MSDRPPSPSFDGAKGRSRASRHSPAPDATRARRLAPRAATGFFRARFPRRHVRGDDGGVRADDAEPHRRAAPPRARRGADVVDDAASRVDERRAREGAEFARCARVRGERGVDSWARRCARARQWTRGASRERERASETRANRHRRHVRGVIAA